MYRNFNNDHSNHEGENPFYNILEETNKNFESANREFKASSELGSETLSNLNEQRDVLINIDDKLTVTHDKASASKSIINKINLFSWMGRKCKKIVIALEIVAIGLLLVYKLIPKRNS